MPSEQLRELANDVARLLAAGSRAAAGDPALRKRGQALRALSAKVPALGAMADAIDRAAEPSAFLDLLAMVRRARAGLAGAGADGTIEPVERSGPWTTASAAAELLCLRDALRQRDWYGAVKEAAGRGTLADLRLLDPLLGWLAGLDDGMAHSVAQDWLRPLAGALVPELLRRFDVRGGKADAARLASLCALDRKAARPLCLRVLTEGDTPLRALALETLTRIAPAEAARLALDLLTTKAPLPLRVAAVQALAPARGEAPLVALLAALDGPFDVWIAAAHALGTVDHPQTTARLLELLHEAVAKAEQAGLTAASVDRVGRRTRALAKRSEPDGVAAVVALLEHPMNLPGDGKTVTVSLNWIDDKAAGAVPPLLAGLKCRYPFLRCRVLEALGKSAGAAPAVVVPALLRALAGDESEDVRAASARELGKVQPVPKGAVAALTRALDDPAVWVAEQAAEALRQIGPAARPAIPALTAALESGRQAVSGAAAAALKACGASGDRVVRGLIALLRHGKCWPDRAHATQALAVCGRGSPEVVAALEAALRDKEDYVRRDAQKALDKLRESAAVR
jgi:HEAT repeat protein